MSKKASVGIFAVCRDSLSFCNPSIADINGDGKMDIVGSQVPDAQGFADVYSFTNLGNHKFEAKLLVNDRIKSIALGDVTQDGKPELITLGGKFSDPDDMSLQVLRNRGDGTFALPQNRPLNNSFKYVISDDFNSDGKADLVALDKSLYVYYNIGNGGFSDDESCRSGWRFPAGYCQH